MDNINFEKIVDEVAGVTKTVLITLLFGDKSKMCMVMNQPHFIKHIHSIEIIDDNNQAFSIDKKKTFEKTIGEDGSIVFTLDSLIISFL